jgi:hypothetical protein
MWGPRGYRPLEMPRDVQTPYRCPPSPDLMIQQMHEFRVSSPSLNRLTSCFDFCYRFPHHTWWFGWPIARGGIVNQAHAEYEIFTFTDVVIIVVDL